MKNKKNIIASRCSFILFTCYILTYIILPIYTKDVRYLIFLFIPVLFLVALIINLCIKYNKLNTDKISRFAKIISILSILFNGADSAITAISVGTTDWEEKKKEVKKYPSITPTWILVLIFSTILFNFCFGLFLSVDEGLSLNLILIFSGISIGFLILCQISSSFSLYYNNGKREFWKAWRTIAIIVLGLIIIFWISGGFQMIIDEYNNTKEKEIFQKRMDTINNVIKNNQK